MAVRYDHPASLAALVAAMPAPVLVGFDVDGVLAPIVRHTDEAELLDEVTPLLSRLAASAGGERRVAVISGRSLDDLGRFGFPPEITVVGSHGMESDAGPLVLTATETKRLGRLRELARTAVDTAGDGAWAESKPASIAVHIREADAESGARALAELEVAVGEVDGASSIVGLAVLELFARTASKGDALRALRGQGWRAVFIGDDVTDEDAFAVLEPGDVRIKVGDAPTIAEHRLRDPAAVVAWLETLCSIVE